MAKVDVYCHKSEQVKGHGKGNGGHPRYRCYSCYKVFQLEYTYQACKPSVKEQIVDIAMNNGGVRNTARILKVATATVMKTFKKLTPRHVTTLPLEGKNIQLICEIDEQWSFVGNKQNQRWLWYAWEPRLKRIVSHVFGDRGRNTLDKLLALLSPFNIRFYCTDNYAAYNNLPEEKHLPGKTFTQRIERTNLTHRTRIKRLNRKTIGYSKSVEMHDKVIGTFIEREHYF
ncbi:IS1 family transposase [Xenorhabdus bovienii]|uniref:IS1 family transposase n=1 Tax=Xenorhabdus bovienii TaxID=40576 RepID=UPI00237D2363|nr:IS1 family transposase [Xenorhabdus bovienii]MDE1485752.1 IS1 family transposase [Xenorhabdus bovienii]MDE1495092.1 IS1 family transposase [Xenorhabdus bovienii]MDE9473143.1 IS1 family transposase [Xenorhabdus bovienii]MDE9476557.1 IS1 family transposase [Xenorhabdus bovienii]MDE9529339.1 IS1 family transposase [Xenorhabdus bovienii]